MLLQRVGGVVVDQIIECGEVKVRFGETVAALRAMDENVSDALLDPAIGNR